MERKLENIRVWQDARVFVNDIYALMKDNRDYGFKDQIQRAAVSIMNNIAEGSECGSDAKYISYLNISKGSCSEVKSMLYLCEDFKYCSREERFQLCNKLQIISSQLYKLIEYLSQNKK